MPKLIAKAAMQFLKESTGHTPSSVAVVLSGDTLVVTLHDALTPAERDLAKTPEGAAQIQAYHRQLFATSSAGFQEAIKQITGVAVRESAAEVELATGAVVHAFKTGTMVQVFLLDDLIADDLWEVRNGAR
ncbi:MAG: DUF2294 domain-containing protein [Phycisphaerales bacterium]|nr:DUF2294 domain-containing protein [Phycisphaerales bacterium]